MINTKQLCKLLKISDKTAYNWRKNEGLPYIQITPKKIQYDEVIVMEWVKDHNVEISPEIDIDNLIFGQIRKLTMERFEDFGNKTVEEQLTAYNQLIKYFIKVAVPSGRQDFLSYMEKWDLKIDDSNKLNRMLTGLNDKDFDGIMLGGLIKQIQEIRGTEIALLCSTCQISIINKRFKYITSDVSELEVAREMADQFNVVLARQERFLEKISALILKNSGNILDELPTDNDIQDLLNEINQE